MRSLAGYLFFLFTVAEATQLSAAQNPKIDSLKKVLLTVKGDSNKVNALNALAWELKKVVPDSSIVLSGQALALSEKNNWQKGIALSNHQLGVFYYLKANYPLALDYYLKALPLREVLKDKKGTGTVLGNIGIVYMYMGNYPKALDFYFKALKIAEEVGDKDAIGRHYSNIGIVYRNQGDLNKALENYLQALKIWEVLKDKSKGAVVLGNIGNVYNQMGDNYPPQKKVHDSLTHKALDYYFKALSVGEEIGDKISIIHQLGNIGTAYNKLADFDKSLEYHLKALKAANETGDKLPVAIAYQNIGGLYLGRSNYKEAEKYLKKAFFLSDSLGDLEGVKEVSQTLSQLYSSTGNFKSALEYYKKHIATRDSITNDENVKKQTRMEMQYVFDKKQSADSIKNTAQLKQEELRHNQEIRQQKTYTYGGIAGFLLMLIVAGVSFRAYKQKQKANGIISFQKQLVEEKQKEILDSIHYAKRIQRSLMPPEKYIEKNLNRLSKK